MYALMNKLATLGLFAGGLANTFGDTGDELTASGTTQADAFESNTGILRFTTVAAGTGVKLDNGSKGDCQLIINDGTETLNVYPPSDQQIEGMGLNTAVTLAPGEAGAFYRITTGRWSLTRGAGNFLAQVTTYTQLRAYRGPALAILVATNSGIGGVFVRDSSDLVTADNGGTVIVAGTVRWKRLFYGPVHVKWFQPVGNGVADDTTPLNNAALAAYGKHLYIDRPSVEYLTGRLIFDGAAANGTVIEFEDGTTKLRKKANGTSCILLQNCEDVTLLGKGGWLYGDSLPGEVSSSHTLALIGVKKVLIDTMNIYGAASVGGGKDCIYIGLGTTMCEDVTIRGGKCLYAKRNGISVVAAKRTLIEGVECAYTTGAPGAGIDLETNDYTNNCYDTEVRGCNVHDNATYGILPSFCDRAKIHNNEVYNNGIHGIANAVTGPMFAVATARLNTDIRAVSAFDMATGLVTVSGDLSRLAVGTVVQFSVSNGAAVPVTFQSQIRWIVDEIASATQIRLAEYLDYNRKTTLSDNGVAGSGAGMTTDPATSNIVLRCYEEGQSSNVDIYDNYVHDNVQYDINLNFMVNVTLKNNRVRHAGSGGASSVALSWIRNLSVEGNEITRSGTDLGYGLFLDGNGVMRSVGNRIRNFSNSGIYAIGCSRGTFVGDESVDSGLTDGRQVQMTKAVGATVADLAIVQNGQIAITQGFWSDATLTNSMLMRINARGAGTSDGNSLVISAANHAIDCIMRSGALYNGGAQYFLQSYTQLRAYTGPAVCININVKDIGGVFVRDATDTTSADNGGTIFVDASSRRWKRISNSPINVRWFGATGNGVTDDTTAVHAAMDLVKATGNAVYFPPGVYRVTTQYTNSTVRGNMALLGPTRTASDINDNLGAIVLLDNATATVAFYEAAAAHNLFVDNLRFRSAQFATDRDFFRFTGTPVNHRFKSVTFENVTRPIVYKAGSYAESVSFSDVLFWNSGTIHSDSNVGSRGNLFILNNVYHGGTTPALTDKIVCNLQGIRGIQATNFLLQGSLPSAGWEVLRLDNEYDPDWGHSPLAQFNGFWSEWSVNAPTYVVRQHGGMTQWNNAVLNLANTDRQYKLEQSAQTRIVGASFTAAATEVNDYFAIEDSKCNVVMVQCAMRLVDETDERFTFENCSFTVDGNASNEPLGAALMNNSQGSLIYKWDGGYVNGPATLTMAAGTATPSTDATYGRRLMLTPAGNALTATLAVPLRGIMTQTSQYNIVALIRLPTFATGTINVQPIEDAGVLSGGAGYDTTFSGQVVKVHIARRIAGAAVATVGLRITSAATGVALTCDVLAFAMYLGNGAPRLEYPSYPNRIETENTAAPAAGTWVVGDRVSNSAPAVGSPKAWRCTVAGTPGTWVSEGNL